MHNINNIPPSPEDNRPINNLINKVKVFFANAFRRITSFFRTKNYIDSTENTDEIKIAKQAKDIIPEHLNLVKDIDVNEITNLKHTDPNTGAIDDYTLGKGSLGKVQLVASKEQKIAPVLIKKQFVDNPDNNINANKEARREHNQNIAFGNDSILDEKNSAIISKYKGGSLKKLLKSEMNTNNQKPLSNEVKASISYQLIEQVANLHKQGILHQDIKPDNILIDAKGKLSIIDLAGASQNASKKQDYSANYKIIMCTPNYSPPEMYIKDTPITQYFDCWSVGTIMYELYTGKSLLGGCVDEKQKFDHNKMSNALRIANDELYTNETIPFKIRYLILQFLTIDRNKRPTAEQALASKAFARQQNIQTMTAIDLNTTHDRHFKKLVDLEVELEQAKKNRGGHALANYLEEAINKEKNDLLKLQQEIQKRQKK
jgi:serine/threonine protein kinase